MTLRFSPAPLAGLAALLLAGCGGDAGPKVRGAVALGGQPVSSGQILFDPDGTKGNNGPQGVADIAGGRFDTAAVGGRQPGPGPAVVRITAYGDPAPGYPNGVPLLRDYETVADLQPGMAELMFDVPAAAKVELPDTPPESP